ncbi:hypothetical protein LVJ82_13590 [Vitreoscilla massiliensis]|uniref:Uncharacterized protein n=1 Tax=Vitreoscilla massiliensis TaxID=1689272 RepID=A0ABY4DY92_9NEIS|nr:hypothetical protein [Vitreoscilla massiliensis]UOO88492.1 hypothetical protein LVJ82_13590 [Vitreoscilla massiliensis]
MKTMMSVAAATVALLCGQYALAEIAAPAIADNTARIRLFGQNGHASVAHVGIDCSSNVRGTKINVGGTLGQAFGSLVGASKNTSLGLAATPATENLKQRNGILSKAFYKEIVVPAGLPLNANSSANIMGTSALNPGVNYVVKDRNYVAGTVSFIPEAGHDYEILSLHEGRKVFIVVNDITHGDMVSVTTQPAYTCTSQKQT